MILIVTQLCILSKNFFAYVVVKPCTITYIYIAFDLPKKQFHMVALHWV